MTDPTPEHWQLICELLDRARELSNEQRDEFIKAIGDSAVRAEIESLLRHEAHTDGVLDKPPVHFPPNEDNRDQRLIGKTVGAYRIQKWLGQGGMGTVYLATSDLHPRMALKVLTGQRSPAEIKRFVLQAQILGRLQHPNVVTVFESGTFDDGSGAMPYIAMECVPQAKTLKEYAEARKLDPHQRLTLFVKVCDAVQHGHHRGIIHRDIKPSNILVNPEGEPMLIDFGVARLLHSELNLDTIDSLGRVIGTPQYMSPEQCGSDSIDLDTRSDVYSLGVVLYELLAGEMPYRASSSNLIEVARTICETPPKPLSMISRAFRGDLDTIVNKALAKERAERYQTAAELAQDIRRYLCDEPIAARPPSLVDQLRRFARQHRAAFVAITAVCATVIIAGLVSTVSLIERDNALDERAKAIEQLRRKEAEFVFTGIEGAIALNDVAEARIRLKQTGRSESSWEYGLFAHRLDHSLASRKCHEHALKDIAISPDGKTLATAAGYHADHVRFWSIVGESIQEIDTGAKTIPCLDLIAWHPHANLLAVKEGETTIALWDISQLKAPMRLPLVLEHPKTVGGIEFSPDGNMIAVGDANSKPIINVWDIASIVYPPDRAATHELPAPITLEGHEWHITSLAFSPRGDRLASGAYDMSVRIWEIHKPLSAARRQPVAVLRGHGYYVHAIAFDCDGRRLASGSTEGTIKIWDVAASEIEYQSHPESEKWRAKGVEIDTLYGHDAPLRAVAFNPNPLRKNLLASAGNDRVIRLWDINDQRILYNRHRLEEHWPAPERKEIGKLRGHEWFIEALAFTPDGERLISGSNDGTVKLWTPEPVEDVPTLLGHRSSVTDVKFLNRGKWLISIGGNRDFRLWDAQTATGLCTLKSETRDTDLLAVSPDESWVASASNDGALELWSFNASIGPPYLIPVKLPNEAKHDAQIVCMAFGRSDKRTLLATGSKDKTARIWDLTDPDNLKLVFTLAHSQHPVTAVAFNRDASQLYTGTGYMNLDEPHVPQAIRTWDVSTGALLSTLSGHDDSIYALAISRDGTYLASASADRSVILWSLDNPSAPKRTRDLIGHAGMVRSLSFHPDGARLASGSDDRMIKLWDVQSGAEVLTLRSQLGGINGLAFSPDGCTLASASAGMDGKDNSVKLWETVVDPATRANRVRIAAATRRGQDLVSAVMYQKMPLDWKLTKIDESNLDDEAKRIGKERARFDHGVPVR